MEQGQIDQNTNLSTLGHPFILTSASLTPLASDCQIIATHQPLENIGNLKVLDKLMFQRTSLLRRLQAQTLPDEAPPVGKIYPFSKIAVTFEPMQRF